MAGTRISKRVWIKASPETVFKALTDAKELARWFCDRASGDPREGQQLVVSWKAGKSNQRGTAVFTRVEPSSAIELTWIDDGDGENREPPGHTLSYEIRAKAGMTEVVMQDKDDVLPDEEMAQILDQGWNSVLLELKDHCERKERAAKPDSHSRPGSRKPALG